MDRGMKGRGRMKEEVEGEDGRRRGRGGNRRGRGKRSGG